MLTKSVFRSPVLSQAGKLRLIEEINQALELSTWKGAVLLDSLESEYRFFLELNKDLTDQDENTISWLLSETFEPELTRNKSFLAADKENCLLVEVGPRLSFTTSWCSNAVSILQNCGLKNVERVERFRRYQLNFKQEIESADREKLNHFIAERLHDRMTETVYAEMPDTLVSKVSPDKTRSVNLIDGGIEELRKFGEQHGLGFDDWDLEFYFNLFTKTLGRNPTDVEIVDLAQSNSEHSRHWFFRGDIVIDGVKQPDSLLDLVRRPFNANPRNSVIAFKDNSSAIKGFGVHTFTPSKVGKPSPLQERKANYDLIFTAETHNFPTGICPFPGAETGTGGRIRDVHATGKGSLVVAGTAGYTVGNLNLPGYEQPWEDPSFEYPSNMATPMQIEVQASNGASDYGNKFGEPLIQGFTRTFGQRLPNGERVEWVKPIMFSAGVGQIDARHTHKGQPQTGMLVVKLGGPAFRIGLGGGSASSMIQGENKDELDFSAVQRGDAEMEQKVNRVIRSCVEMGDENPIVSIHDQGAGGNCNVVKEIVAPAGASINIRDVLVGDDSLSVLEIWVSEYQENDALLIRPEALDCFTSICTREKAPFSVVGKITGDGYIVVHDSESKDTPVNLELTRVLDNVPTKEFQLERLPVSEFKSETKTPDIGVEEALGRVCKLVSVGSKRFLTSKVDRCVTGLIARQQCVGPYHLPLSNVALIAQGYFGNTGAAISVGEQPIKGLLNPQAMARLSLTEALTNIMWAKLTHIEDIKCSGNWMWAAKLPGEGAKLYDAALALSEAMLKLGIAIDGGKDSLSMAAKVVGADGNGEIVKSPGTLVVSAYCSCPDITKVITPDLKESGSVLFYVNLSGNKFRLGASALMQVCSSVGAESPDLESLDQLKNALIAVQDLIDKDLLLAGHDVSDGGLIVCLMEMCLSGGFGATLDLSAIGASEDLPVLFAEEPGFVLEVRKENEVRVRDVFGKLGVDVVSIGSSTDAPAFRIERNGNVLIDRSLDELRLEWEATSFELEQYQTERSCLEEELAEVRNPRKCTYEQSYVLNCTAPEILNKVAKPKVAILREEGTNSDRELGAAFHLAGFEAWDISMTDLLNEDVSLKDFKGLAFAGGFSYGDVLDSAKGWAAVIKFNRILAEQFDQFYHRTDTFSLGVCNGCQLMALLGWVPWRGIEMEQQPRFIHNRSGRFECRFVTLKVVDSPAIFLKDMNDSRLGVWSAHGEGRAHFSEPSILSKVEEDSLIPLRYVDADGSVTMQYPLNPNGSVNGIAALCSPDGRHMAMMSHPERSFMTWQWPWLPNELKRSDNWSPWMKLFQNAYEWIESA